MERRVIILRAVYTAVFTALVFAATAMIAIETPATRGFFNFGETMVYTTAIVTMDPVIAFIAGGLGSALADIYLGYGHYAPGTFVIKGIEGVLAVLIISMLMRVRRHAKLAVAATSLFISILLCVYGIVLYSGETILYFMNTEYRFVIPKVFWIILSAIILCVILLIGFRYEPRVSMKIVGLLLAGMEMVLGYYLYQVFVLGFKPPVAATEIPVNVGQAVIGVSVGIPISETLRRMGVGVVFGASRAGSRA